MTVLSSFERIYPSLNLHVSESDPRIQLNEDRTEINKENGSCYYGNRDPFVSRRIARRIATVCGRRNCASSQPWNRGLSSFYAVPRVADSFLRSSNNFQLSKVRYSTRRETRARARKWVKAIIVIARIVKKRKKRRGREREKRKERKNNREFAASDTGVFATPQLMELG